MADPVRIESALHGQTIRLVSDAPPLESKGGEGHDGGMDDVLRRVAALEGDVKEVKADMKALTKDVAEIKGRLSQMPTTFQMLTWFVGVSLGLTGLVFTIARLVGAH